MKKRIISFLLALVMLFNMGTPVLAAEETKQGKPLPEFKEITVETKYHVPIELWQAYQDKESMGNQAIESPALMTVHEDGSAEMMMPTKELYRQFGGQSLAGHLTNFFTREGNEKQASKIEAIPGEKTTSPDSGVSYYTSFTFALPKEAVTTEGRFDLNVAVWVDAMDEIASIGQDEVKPGAGEQSAILHIFSDQKALVSKVTRIDKTPMEAEIADAKAASTENKTVESIAALHNAVEAAEAAYDNEEATVEDLNKAVVALREAVSKLKEKKAPELIEGDNAVVDLNKEAKLTVRFTAPLSDFVSVSLDGKELTKKQYTLTEGSTIVTVKEDYLKTLPAGEHTLKTTFTNGEVSSKFTVVPVKEEPEKPAEPEKPTVNPGTYLVPIFVANYSSPNSESMSHAAFQKMVPVTVTASGMDVVFKLQPVIINPIRGHLEKLWIYSSVEASKNHEEPKLLTPESFYSEEGKEYPEKYVAHLDGAVPESMAIKVKVDAMGDYTPNALIKFDWAKKMPYSEEDLTAAQAWDAKVPVLGKVEYDRDFNTLIDLRLEYDAMSKAQKALVTKKASFKELENQLIDRIIEKLGTIPDGYTNFTDLIKTAHVSILESLKTKDASSEDVTNVMRSYEVYLGFREAFEKLNMAGTIETVQEPEKADVEIDLTNIHIYKEDQDVISDDAEFSMSDPAISRTGKLIKRGDQYFVRASFGPEVLLYLPTYVTDVKLCSDEYDPITGYKKPNGPEVTLLKKYAMPAEQLERIREYMITIQMLVSGDSEKDARANYTSGDGAKSLAHFNHEQVHTFEFPIAKGVRPSMIKFKVAAMAEFMPDAWAQLTIDKDAWEKMEKAEAEHQEPEKPDKPTPEKPDKPTPEKPDKPTPEKPNKPAPKKPNKPASKKPTPQKPIPIKKPNQSPKTGDGQLLPILAVLTLAAVGYVIVDNKRRELEKIKSKLRIK